LRELDLGVEDAEPSSLLERRHHVRHLEQQASQRPHVHFIANPLLHVKVDHFRGTIHHGRITIDILLNGVAQRITRRKHHISLRTSKITQLIGSIITKQHILGLNIAMDHNRGLLMQNTYRSTNLKEDVPNTRLGQAFTTWTGHVDHISQITS